MSSFKALMVAAGTLAVLATPATAERKKANADPNRMICEKQEVLGSRLQAKRVCKTAAEWEIQRQLDRQQIDKSQNLRHQPTGG
jgi:hypothetical protein